MKKILLALAICATLLSSAAQAKPWCWGGYIMEIADISWNEAEILYYFNAPWPAPGTAYDLEKYVAWTAMNNYAQTLAGGGGSLPDGSTVPGSGTVVFYAYAPDSYINFVGPGYYFITQGISFKIEKCFTVPPIVEVPRLEERM